MTIRVKTNTDKDLVKEIKNKLKVNEGYCPCRISKTEDNKCMCKEFRDMIANGIVGTCHCGLYIITKE